MDEKRILVLGRSGQLASELQGLAWPADIEVRFRGRSEVDLLNKAAMDAAMRDFVPHIVINAAAYTAVDKAEEEVDQAYALNANAVAQLADLTARMDIPLLHVSTDYVFDGRSQVPYLETDAVNPLSVYGASKAAGEAEIRRLAPRHVIVRASWLFGSHGNNFLKTMLRLSTTRNVISVVDDQHGGPTPSLDLATALQEITLQNLAGREDAYGTFHFCGTPETTWHDFAREILIALRDVTNAAPILERIGSAEYVTLAQRPKRSTLDCSKIETVYGISQPDWARRVVQCAREVVLA